MASDSIRETDGKMFGILDLADNLVFYYFVLAFRRGIVGEIAALFRR